MLKTLRLAIVMAMPLAFGCEEKKEPTPPPPPAPAAAPAAPAAAPAAPAANAAPSANAPAPAEAMKALGNALGAAAEATGDTPCEKAYNGMSAMVKAMEKQLGAGKGKPMPEKEKFVAACKKLPPAVQQCMDMSYGMAHQQECQEAQKKMDPTAMAEMKAMMGK